MHSASHSVMESRYTKRVTTTQHQTVTMTSFASGQLAGEKRKAKKVVTRSISLNFNSAHALNLRLRRGHQLLSPLNLRHPDFRQVSFPFDHNLLLFSNN
ncbi:uncharacterized protein CDAR_256541 [Caerostris darwini]|uniref:Uncharacterized protein n=1 Tax=Caerostris darwini TaxID=1538125 RepID=A0AAV4PDY0_9ARAC|nr:uncharacterized protein CDAR_256541 [Caerostris darwini]